MAESMFESVEKIVVEALAKQDSYARYRGGPGVPTEPDSRKVTLDIIEAFADGLERDKHWSTHNNTIIRWLRAQASTNGGDDE